MGLAPAPRWLENRIIEGVQMLIALRLTNAPAEDSVNALVDVWCVAFMARCAWFEARDVPRLHHAFARAAASLERWPTPAQVLDKLPHIQSAVPSLEWKKSKLSPEESKRRFAELNATLKSMKAPAVPESTHSPVETNAFVQAQLNKEISKPATTKETS